MKRLLGIATALSSTQRHTGKRFHLACVAVRADGTIVAATNSKTRTPEPQSHAEARVLKKAGKGAVLVVARTLADGSWALAKPCTTCQSLIKSRKVKKVVYTISQGEYGVWRPNG